MRCNFVFLFSIYLVFFCSYVILSPFVYFVFHNSKSLVHL